MKHNVYPDQEVLILKGARKRRIRRTVHERMHQGKIFHIVRVDGQNRNASRDDDGTWHVVVPSDRSDREITRTWW